MYVFFYFNTPKYQKRKCINEILDISEIPPTKKKKVESGLKVKRRYTEKRKHNVGISISYKLGGKEFII